MPDVTIINFIKEHHVLTLATSRDNKPYCCNCFYAYSQELNLFVFTSDKKTRHISEAMEQPMVSGSIVLETSIIGKIQGIQFTGVMYEPKGDLSNKVNKIYLKRFPFAALMDTQLWVLEPNFIKMTDNRLGFGKKLIWEKDISSSETES